MNNQEKENTVNNIVSTMKEISGERKDDIINRQLCQYFRADSQLGMAVAKGLGITVDEKMMKH